MNDELAQQLLQEMKNINVKMDKFIVIGKELLNKIEGKL